MREEKRPYQPSHTMSKASPEKNGIGKGHDYQDRRGKEMNYPDRMGHKDQRGYYKSQDMHHQPHSDPRIKQDSNYGYMQERSRVPQYEEEQQPRMMRHSSGMTGNGVQQQQQQQQSFLHNPLANSRQSVKMKPLLMGMGQDPQSLDQLNSNIDMYQNPSHNQDSYLYNDVIQSPSMNDMMSMPNNSEGGAVMSHLDQYVLPQNASNLVDSSGIGSNPNYMSGAGGVQSMPMSNLGMPSNSNSGGRVSVQYSSMPANSSSMPGWGAATTGMYNQTVPNYMDALVDLCEQFHNILPIPKNATNTVYVEGIPVDAKEREVARKSQSVT